MVVVGGGGVDATVLVLYRRVQNVLGVPHSIAWHRMVWHRIALRRVVIEDGIRVIGWAGLRLGIRRVD